MHSAAARLLIGLLLSVSAVGLLSPLFPPIFDANLDATQNNPFAQNGAAIAINPDNPLRVLISANDYRSALRPEVYVSSDGGGTWMSYAPGNLAGSPLYYGNPALAFGHNNLTYLGYYGYSSSNPVCGGQGGMYVSRSADAGVSFASPTRLAANSNNGTVAQFQDREGLAVDLNPASPHTATVYLAWTRFAFRAVSGCGSPATQLDASIMLSRSSDTGLTWSVPITVSPAISSNNWAAVPAVGLDGTISVAYLGAATQSQANYDSLLFSRSTDGGQTFPFFTRIASVVDLPRPLPPGVFPANAAGALAADGTVPGILYVVWSDYRTGDADILFSRSTDNGTTWEPPRRVNDDGAGNHKDQFFPWIATSGDGRVHIAWLDRRDDPANANYREYYTYSKDQGVTFAPNIPVASAPSQPGFDDDIGAYTGLAAVPGVVMPAWTDIRTPGNQNIYTARGAFLSPTPTATGTLPTATMTPTSLPPQTGTSTPPGSPTATETMTPTGTRTGTPTRTGTVTRTATPTRTIVPSPSPTPCYLRFLDVNESDYFFTAVQYLACHGVVSGYSDGTFRPYATATRAQLVKIVTLGFNIPIQTPAAGGYTFADVPTAHTFYSYVETAAGHGIATGYPCGGTNPQTLLLEPCDAQQRPYFRPQNPITRGQIAKIIVSTAGWPLLNPPSATFSDVLPGSAFYSYVETAVCHSIVGGYSDGTFRPMSSALRGQIAKIVYNALQDPNTCLSQ